MAERSVEPVEVVDLVEEYASAELADARQYQNRTPLDESGIYSLHVLAGRIYELGVKDGRMAEARREDGRRRREREADRG